MQSSKQPYEVKLAILPLPPIAPLPPCSGPGRLIAVDHINGDPCRVASGPFLLEEDTSRREDRGKERSVNVVTSSLALLNQCMIMTVLL